ncbi:hypothetical protein B0H17DRAFT_1199931 [Mycena rosella]|uniref:Uncharacterized protein n=1 Tax=Mycena rosella TaxID=1033263 RepID=A0AAD7DKD7_MYCRO|nr:hypothetical protein B0H17DRAFT_1199931 [Mycena rosella]
MPHIPKILVAGLGNWTAIRTRQNLGHHIIDEVAWYTGIRMSTERDGFSGDGTVTLGETRLSMTLYKHKHLASFAGPFIASVCRKRGLRPDMVVLVAESTAYAPRTLTVITALGTQDFHRLRVGVGRDPAVGLSEYVSAALSKDESEFWCAEGADLVYDAIEKIARKIKE